MTPLISIVIPALNEEKYLPLLLEDLSQQTEHNFEVLVVDGNSDDRTRERALTFSQKIPLTVIDSPKRNLSLQRNLGAKNAKGKYLFFLDADFRVEPDLTAKVVKHLQDNGLLYLPYPKPSTSTFMNNIQFKIGIDFVVLINKLGRPYAIGPAIIMPKEFFEKIGGFDEKAYVSEDQNLVIKARKAGAKPKFLPDVTYLFSMRRFETENRFLLMWKYFIFTIITMFKGAVYSDKLTYQMGGKSKHTKDSTVPQTGK